MTTTFDASPLTSVPTGLPTLPTGTYALPLGAPSTAAKSCLVNTAQSDAWACNIPMAAYTISTSGIQGTSQLSNNKVDFAIANTSFPGWYAYGTQPPVLGSSQVLNLVSDIQDPGKGPAWFFELPYNKVVIVEEDTFTSSGTKRDLEDRDTAGRPASSFMRKNIAQIGDKPWFCYWNGTLLEAFIYVSTVRLPHQISLLTNI